MFALLMQALVFLSPFLPHQLKIQDIFCLKLHDVTVQHVEHAQHSSHDDLLGRYSDPRIGNDANQHDHQHADHHEATECTICVLHHLVFDQETSSKVYEVNWRVQALPDFSIDYTSIILSPLAFKYPLKQGPPDFIA